MILRIEEMQNACGKILAAVDSNNLSVLTETLQIKTEGRSLYISVTNREYFAKVRIEIDSDVDFHATVNANLFLKLVSQITTDTIEMNVVENSLVLKGNGTYKLPLIFDGDKLLELPEININNPTVNFAINSETLLSILQYNSNVYVNYGCQFNYTDDGYKYQEGILGYEVDSALLVPRDSNSLKTDYHFIVDESGHFIKDKVVGGCYSRGNAEFIELNAHFQTNLIYGPAGVPVGIIVKQVNRPTAATNTEANSGYNGIGTYYPNGTSSGNIGSNIGGASGGGGGLLPDTWDSVEGNIPPENVVVQVAGGSGGGQFAVGDTVTLVADEGVGTFVGWYQGSTLVSTSKTFNFSPTSNGHYTLTAKWRS